MAQHFATGYALNARDLFKKFPTRSLEMTAQECMRLDGDRNKERVAEKVFKCALSLILDDIIDNNVTFKLPTGKKKAELYVKKYEGDVFTNCRQGGMFQDVNFLNSNFTGHKLALKFQQGENMVDKVVNVDKTRAERLVKYTNEGKVYY